MNGADQEKMGGLLRETFRAMVEGVSGTFEGTDMVLSQWLALKLIGEGRIVCIGDVSREIGLESGAATRLVDQLESRRLLERRRERADRRVVDIALTQQGRLLLADLHPRFAKFWEARLSIFAASERDMLFQLLLRLRNELSHPSSENSFSSSLTHLS